jgi:uncharacterized protein
VRFQRFESSIQLRLEPGDELTGSLLALLAAERIGYASITGLGALRSVTLAFWDRESREYETHDLDEQVELVSLIGNAALRDGQPALHLHAAIGRRDLSLVGGHVMAAVANPNVEVWLHPQKASVSREIDPTCGLPLMQLPERLED